MLRRRAPPVRLRRPLPGTEVTQEKLTDKSVCHGGRWEVWCLRRRQAHPRVRVRRLEHRPYSDQVVMRNLRRKHSAHLSNMQG